MDTFIEKVGRSRSRGSDSRNVNCQSVWVALNLLQAAFDDFNQVLHNITNAPDPNRLGWRSKTLENLAEMILKLYICTEKRTTEPPYTHTHIFPFFQKQTQNKQIQKQIIWHYEHLASVKS